MHLSVCVFDLHVVLNLVQEHVRGANTYVRHLSERTATSQSQSGAV